MSSYICAWEHYRSAGARLARFWETRGRATFGAMSATGGGALVSGLLSAAAAKILASQGGPTALATLVTLQQARQGGLIAATVNGQTAVIQGATSRNDHERREYVRTSALLFVTGTLLVGVAFFLFPEALRRLPGLATVNNSAFRWLAATVLFSSVFLYLTSILNAMGRIGTLAILQMVAPLSFAVGMWLVMRGAVDHYVVPASGSLSLLLALTAAIPAAAAAWALTVNWIDWKDWIRGCGRLWSNRAARAFLSISAAMLVSGLIATGALMAVRGRIIEQHGLTVAGWFDAAWNISMNHASLLLASLQTYCLPALARAKSAREQSDHIAGVFMLAMPAAAAMIAVIALAKPVIIDLLYAPSFRNAAGLLRWTLLGDYLKIGSWILSLPLLARADMKAFLLLDTVAYGTFVIGSIMLSDWLPRAEGAAAAFACMYAVHLCAGAVLARRRCGIRLERSAVTVWCLGLLIVALASGFTWNRLS